MNNNIIFNPNGILNEHQRTKFNPYLYDLNYTFTILADANISVSHPTAYDDYDEVDDNAVLTPNDYWDKHFNHEIINCLSKTYYLFNHIKKEFIPDIRANPYEYDLTHFTKYDAKRNAHIKIGKDVYSKLFNSIFCLKNGKPYVISDKLYDNLLNMIDNHIRLEMAMSEYESFTQCLQNYVLDMNSHFISELMSFIHDAYRIEVTHDKFNNSEEMIAEFLTQNNILRRDSADVFDPRTKLYEMIARKKNNSKIIVQSSPEPSKPKPEYSTEDGYEIQHTTAKRIRNRNCLNDKHDNTSHVQTTPSRVVGQPPKVTKTTQKDKKEQAKNKKQDVKNNKYSENMFGALVGR